MFLNLEEDGQWPLWPLPADKGCRPNRGLRNDTVKHSFENILLSGFKLTFDTGKHITLRPTVKAFIDPKLVIKTRQGNSLASSGEDSVLPLQWVWV